MKTEKLIPAGSEESGMTVKLQGILPQSFKVPETRSFGSAGFGELWEKVVVFSPGERYLISGASGTGKTSLSAFLSGRRFDYSGEIALEIETRPEKKPTTNQNRKNRWEGEIRFTRTFSQPQWSEFRTSVLSQVFQDLRLIPTISLIDNIELARGALPKKHGRATAREIASWAEELEISAVLTQEAGRCSRGEQQRAAILRALVSRTPFILLDEAFSHLDHNRSVTAAKLIDRVARSRTAAVIHLNIEADELFEYDERYRL